MGFFSKDSLSGALGRAKGLADKAAETAKTSIEQTKTAVSGKTEQLKQNRRPQEGGMARYEVTYKGGHPEFQLGKKKSPYIMLDIMPDRFSFIPKNQSADWFTGFDIYYNQVSSIEIVDRIISTAEMLISSNGDNSDLRQKNVMEITYSNDDNEYIVRAEMLTGITVMGQAKVCQEMMDLLRTNGILKKFKGVEKSAQNLSGGADDIIGRIEKLAKLKEQGILSEQEFAEKKAELLAKI